MKLENRRQLLNGYFYLWWLSVLKREKEVLKNLSGIPGYQHVPFDAHRRPHFKANANRCLFTIILNKFQRGKFNHLRMCSYQHANTHMSQYTHLIYAVTCLYEIEICATYPLILQ